MDDTEDEYAGYAADAYWAAEASVAATYAAATSAAYAVEVSQGE